MVKKEKRPKRINIKRERQRLLKEKRKQLQKQDLQPDKKSTKKIDIRLEKETKLYWTRAFTAILSGIFGRLIFGLVGWWLLLWMVIFWLLAPFIISKYILKYEYDKEEWNWKNIIKPGLGIYFLLFMITTIFIHTFLAFL
jgi:Flp pilus assembly protein TadB